MAETTIFLLGLAAIPFGLFVGWKGLLRNSVSQMLFGAALSVAGAFGILMLLVPAARIPGLGG